MKNPWLIGILVIATMLLAYCIAIFWPRSYPNRGQEPIAIAKPLEHVSLSQMRRSGSVTIARLKSLTIIDGFPCAAGWVHFDESARLRAFYLDETCTIQGNQIPKGTWVQLDSDLKLRFCSFPEDTNIQGYICDGGFGGPEGVSTSFYPSGRLKQFFSPNDIVIQGFPCKASLFSPIYFYENGNLKEFTLSQEAVVGGRTLTAWQTVVLGEGGEVQSISNPAYLTRVRNWVARLFR